MDVWLNNDRHLVPGRELFRSDRRFHLSAYTASHSQLLLRSDPRHDDDRAGPDTIIEVLFKPVEVVTLRQSLTGLVIRCAPVDEARRIRASLPGVSGDGLHVFLLESGGRTDHVVSMALGWREGVLPRMQQSLFNPPAAAKPSWPVTPLDGVDPGLTGAPVEDLLTALRDDDAPDARRRERHRYVFVLTVEVDQFGRTVSRPAGVFLTDTDAAEAAALIAPEVVRCRVDQVPIVL